MAGWHEKIIHAIWFRSSHGRPPSRTLDLGHRLGEVARAGAVVERDPQDGGGDVVLQVGVEPHGPTTLGRRRPRGHPVRLSERRAAREGRCGSHATEDEP